MRRDSRSAQGPVAPAGGQRSERRSWLSCWRRLATLKTRGLQFYIWNRWWNSMVTIYRRLKMVKLLPKSFSRLRTRRSKSRFPRAYLLYLAACTSPTHSTTESTGWTRRSGPQQSKPTDAPSNWRNSSLYRQITDLQFHVYTSWSKSYEWLILHIKYNINAALSFLSIFAVIDRNAWLLRGC